MSRSRHRKKITLPSVTTSAVTSITSTSAAAGGNVTSDGGATVTERGVCWGSTANPTISGSHTHAGSGTGSFTSSLTGLTPEHDVSCPGLRDELLGDRLRERCHIHDIARNNTAFGDDLGGDIDHVDERGGRGERHL